MAGKEKGAGVAQTCRGLATETDRVCEGISKGVPPGRTREGRAGKRVSDGTAPPRARNHLTIMISRRYGRVRPGGRVFSTGGFYGINELCSSQPVRLRDLA